MNLVYGIDYTCRYVDLPYSVKGFVVRDADDFCTIYINTRHSLETQHLTYKHELNHLISEDHQDYDVDKIERYN